LTAIGEKYPMMIPRDFQITNAALGEELRSKDGRSVVKVTHHPIPPSAFDSDSEEDSDSEIDSELEAELRDEFDIDSDEEIEEDEEEDGPSEKPKAKVNGVKKGEAEVDEEEDDEDEDEEDDDYSIDSDDEVEETNVICSLTAGKVCFPSFPLLCI